ncbi:MAG: hypothetical protein AAF622_09665 [Cyanobacteria bacterium P01_C01_bin.147]
MALALSVPRCIWLSGSLWAKRQAHRLRTAITAEHLHDDRWGRASDTVWETGLSGLLMTIARPGDSS